MNDTMINTSQFTDISEFLAKHSAKNGNNQPYTHSRIPDETLKIYGGSYVIPREDLPTFYKLYYEHVFVNKKKEYLTEKQLEIGGCIAVDFDFRYNSDVCNRLHSPEHVHDMVITYLEELKKFFIFEENKPFHIFIFEKPNINRLKDGSMTKDGIHMIIGIQMDHILQLMLREKIIQTLPDAWSDLSFINTWDSILDEGISKGKTGWQLYGSRKPGHEAYGLVRHFVINFDKRDGEFMMGELDAQDFDVKNNFEKLSVQCDTNPKFELNPKIVDAYNKRLENKSPKIKRPISKIKVNLLVEKNGETGEDDYISLSDIKDRETLEKAMNQILKTLKSTEYDIKEAHDYTQILPEKYYQPGSHLLNRQVAFALKHTDERLFLSWIMLRSNASDFDYNTIPNLYRDWKKYFNVGQKGITKRSIMYWAKQDNFEGYERVKKESIDYFIEESLNSQTEYDKALVLRQMYKDKYVCVSYEKKGMWFVFEQHRWISDPGLTLRSSISKQMYDLYSHKRDRLDNEYHHYEETDPRAESIKKRIKTVSDLMITLKKTDQKNNIMREAAELFYDRDFIKQMDTNKYLLCFNNGVVDFDNKIFRDGYPHDYITKTTRINYQHYEPNNSDNKQIADEIFTFMKTLFPKPDLNSYMWDHLASCLIGSGKNQCFNVYHGSGSNGKSILTDLMSVCLGEYKGTVPITLVTEKRGLIGGTSDEVLKLKGVRYAVMQEPSKNVKLNEGIMKELTGGDPIQARGLYSESEIFEPQFNLVVCTNNLFDIESNDDGTWRRIKKVDFMSKFIDEGEDYNDETPYIFPKDKALKDKLPLMAPIFMSMLVKRAFETNGIVVDCETVIGASNKYRKGQDHIAGFITEKIIKTGNKTDKIGKAGLYQDFKIWFQQEQGNRKIPKGQELYDFMDKKFGQHGPKGWLGVTFVKSEENNEGDGEIEEM
jgi:P4 family phage/plasmid primase-like protien